MSTTTRRRAPRSAYALMAATGAALCVALSWLTMAFSGADTDRPLQFALSLVVYAPVAFAIAWFVAVARHTATPEPHAQEGVEVRWLERATSGAFLDLLTALGLTLAVLGIARLPLDATALLIVVVPAAMADVAVRYLLLRRRES